MSYELRATSYARDGTRAAQLGCTRMPGLMSLLKKRPRVLVLDDDAAMRKLVSLLLERAGYRVDTVTKGNDAIKAIATAQYTAILLDLMMPHEGGMTVMKHLRESKPDMLRRVILMTAAPESVLRTAAQDIFTVVKKPFESDELTKAVARVAAS